MNKFIQLLCVIASKKNGDKEHAIAVINLMKKAAQFVKEVNQKYALDCEFNGSLNQLDENNYSPLMYAAGAGNLALLRWLIEEHKVDLNVLPKDSQLENHQPHLKSALSVATESNQLAAVNLLLQHYSSDDGRYDKYIIQALFTGIPHNNLQILKSLLHKIVNKDAIAQFFARENYSTLLHVAIQYNADVEIIRELVTACPRLIITADKHHTPAINKAISAGNISYVYVLTHAVTDIKLVSKQVSLTLSRCYAKRFNQINLKIFYLLLKAGARVSQSLIESICNNIVHRKSSHHIQYFIYSLLAAEGNLNAIAITRPIMKMHDANSDEPLPAKFSHFADQYYYYLEEMLSGSGLSLMERLDIVIFALRQESGFGDSSREKLNIAKSALQVQITQTQGQLELSSKQLTLEKLYLSLHDNNATIGKPDSQMTTPIIFNRVRENFLETLLFLGLKKLTLAQYAELYDHVTVLKSQPSEIFQQATQFSRLAARYQLYALNPWEVDTQQVYDNGSTLLTEAIFLNDESKVDFLIDKGADVNCLLRASYTPFLLAVEFGNPFIINKLLQAGADSQATNSSKQNCLMIAVRNRYTSLFSLLNRAGVTLEAVSTEGKTALEIAFDLNNLESVNELLRLGAKHTPGFVQSIIEQDSIELFVRLVDTKALDVINYPNDSILHNVITNNAFEIWQYLFKNYFNLINFSSVDAYGNSFLHLAAYSCLKIYEDILKQKLTQFKVADSFDNTVCDQLVGLLNNYLLKNDGSYAVPLANSKDSFAANFYQKNKHLSDAELHLSYARTKMEMNTSLFHYVERVTLLFIYEDENNRLVYSDATKKYLIPIRHYIGASIHKMMEDMAEGTKLEFALVVKQKMQAFSLGPVLNYHEYLGWIFGKSNTFKQIESTIPQFDEEGHVLVNPDRRFATLK